MLTESTASCETTHVTTVITILVAPGGILRSECLQIWLSLALEGWAAAFAFCGKQCSSKCRDRSQMCMFVKQPILHTYIETPNTVQWSCQMLALVHKTAQKGQSKWQAEQDVSASKRSPVTSRTEPADLRACTLRAMRAAYSMNSYVAKQLTIRSTLMTNNDRD